MLRSRLTVAALAALISLCGHAADAPSPDRDAELQKRFAAADKDHDGKLTREEAQAGLPKVARNFDVIDRDRKGYVTLEDIRRAMAGRGH